jgi:hypothetical protein
MHRTYLCHLYGIFHGIQMRVTFVKRNLESLLRVAEGMREPSADLLIFVDDDNVLTRSYLCDAVTIKGEWAFVGRLG